MFSRSSIVTTFHGPTNKSWIRYTAKTDATGGRVSVVQDDNLTPLDNHAAAARKLATKLGWTGRYVVGTLPSGQHVFTLSSDDTAAFTVGAVKPSGPVYLAQYIGTTNDTNGNPRRGWYVSRIDGSEETTWIEEGYGNFPWSAFADKLGMPAAEGEAWHSVRDRVRPFVKETGKIDVTPGEYRDARKLPRFARAE